MVGGGFIPSHNLSRDKPLTYFVPRIVVICMFIMILDSQAIEAIIAIRIYHISLIIKKLQWNLFLYFEKSWNDTESGIRI